MVEGGMSCVKYLVFFFNLLFFIFGALLIGLGAYVQIELHKYLDFFEIGSVNGPAIVLMVFGGITLIVAFFGCCGAYKEHYCMTMTFAALITIILICELGGGIAAFVLKGKVDDFVTKGMQESMEKYNTSDGVKIAWDSAQKEFKCCGVNSSADWEANKLPIPASCTCNDKKDCKDGTVGQPYPEPCLSKLKDFAEENIAIIAGAGVGLAVVEMLGIIFACCLARSVKREHEYV